MDDHRFATLFELLPIGAYRSHPDGRQLRANAALVHLNGYANEAEMLAAVKDINQAWYVDPGRRDQFIAEMERTGQVRDFVSEVYRHKSRQRIWIRENAHCVRDADGKILYYEGTVEDITDERENALSLQVALDNAGKGILRMTAEGIVTLYNRALLELLDLPESLLRSRPHGSDILRFQIARGDFGPEMQALKDAGINTLPGMETPAGMLAVERYQRRTATGATLEVETRRLPDGSVIRTYTDVSRFVETQRDAREKAAALGIALDSMAEGFALIAADGRTLVSNRRHREMLDLPDALMDRQPTQEELVRLQIARGDFGPDLTYVEAMARGYIVQASSGAALAGPQRYRRRTPDGRTLEVRTAPLPDGGAVRTFHDISSHVAVQQALQIVLDNAGRGIAMVDSQQRVVFYNQNFATLLDLEPAWLDQRPSMRELLDAMTQRGDFRELEGTAPAALAHLPLNPPIPPDGSLPPRYLRRTRSGRVIEVNSVELADGASVRTYSDVTDYVVAEQALAQAQKELALALDSMDQGLLVIDAKGRAILSNRRHRELLKLPDNWMEQFPYVRDLIRLQIERGDFGPDLSFISPEARAWVSRYPDRTGDEMPAVYWRTTTDGRTLEVRSKRQSDGGVVRTFTDVTDSVRARETLEHSNLRLRTLVNTLPDRVWLKDTAGVYQLANQRFCLHARRTEAEILGRTAADLFPDDMLARFNEQDRAVLQSHHPIVFEEMQRGPRTGLPRHFEVVKVAMRDASGRAVGVLGVSRDITDRKRSEAALLAARDAAEAGARAKAQFLANMSHEIRTPMNAVIGMSDLLAETRLDEEQQDFVRTIRASGNQLLTLINDILDFSKIDGGHLELEQLPVDIAECLEGVLDLLSAPAGEKALALYYRIDPALPLRMLADPVRLRQVLVNLVANAVKFTPRGEIVLSARRISGPTAAAQTWVRFDVSDTGIGIPHDRMDRLFQVFSQVDMSTTRQYGGTGLGLAICQRLVHLMGGTISVRSDPGEGSVFSVLIPLMAAQDAPAERQPDLSRLAGWRLLIVDNHAGHAGHLAELVGRWSLKSTVFSSAQDVHRWLDAGGRCDLVVLDTALDRAPDAPPLAHWLRNHPRSRAWPLLLLTQPGQRQDLQPLVPCRAIRRPVKARALAEALLDLAGLLPPQQAPVPTAVTDQAPTRPLKILLAEDNPVSLRVTRFILDRLGHECTVAATGKAALAATQAAAQAGRPFDVILMDAQMPDTDGLSATRALRVLLPAREQPWIIALTAGGPQGDRNACLAAGMDDYLAKPMRPDDLAAALANARRLPGGQ